MKIKGYGEVSAIRFTHKGCDMNFEHIFPAVYMGNIEVEPSTIAFLEFKDIGEIDTLIYMLKKFKQTCIDGMGRWKGVNEYEGE